MQSFCMMKLLCPARIQVVTALDKIIKGMKRRILLDQMQIELLEIDFNSEEAIYMQLRNQIILGIATSRLQDGDTLPSVRQMAECIGINMHTVNKAYAVLRKEGIVSIDRRKGAVICIDSNKLLALEEMRQNLYIILAKGRCHNISRQEAHRLLDEIYDMWEQSPEDPLE